MLEKSVSSDVEVQQQQKEEKKNDDWKSYLSNEFLLAENKLPKMQTGKSNDWFVYSLLLLLFLIFLKRFLTQGKGIFSLGNIFESYTYFYASALKVSINNNITIKN